jgi:hypothetical protein
MTADEKLERFLERVAARPLPQNPMARLRTLAKELAEGAAEGVWGSSLHQFRGAVTEQSIGKYIHRRWGNLTSGALAEKVEDLEKDSGYLAWGDGIAFAPGPSLLLSNGYLEFSQTAYLITKAAFELVEETEPANIFISYRRRDSSAFALLVLARLKAAGLEPFLDLALEAGEDWRKGLRERIRRYDYLIALLGAETLKSEIVIQELEWALEADVDVLPIWHGGFHYRPEDWPHLPASVAADLASRHTIRVLEESALAYNNAIVELLNRFGVTP